MARYFAFGMSSTRFVSRQTLQQFEEAGGRFLLCAESYGAIYAEIDGERYLVNDVEASRRPPPEVYQLPKKQFGSPAPLALPWTP
jgi:hypothetical protein